MKMRLDTSDLAVQKMVDFKGKDFTEEVRFKTNQLNHLLMSYLRSSCKAQFFQGKIHDPAFAQVLLTKPKNLYFERYCLQFYENLVEFLLMNLEKPSTLENDLEMLDSYNHQAGEESKD